MAEINEPTLALHDDMIHLLYSLNNIQDNPRRYTGKL